MFNLKPLSKDAIESALSKAERYRLLNEPDEAESICLDILEIDPQNQHAQVMLLLALSDRCGDGSGAAARAHLDRGGAIPHGAYDWLMDALDYFERAEAVRPPGNDDAILRWNTCVRLLKKHPELGPSPAMREEPLLLE